MKALVVRYIRYLKQQKMIYYSLTQGTNSSEYSFILKNGNIIDLMISPRDEIIEKFQEIDRKARISVVGIQI